MILDEPTDGLDPNQKFEMRKLIKSISKNKGIIISTHILEEVEAVCSRTIIISSGKVLLNKETKDLFNEDRLKKMKKTARIINVSRGGIINEEDLAKSLKNNDISGAAIDVFAK